MNKIMFNDHFVLTEAVIDGRKTMTRRIVGNRMTEDDIRAYLKGYTELANKCAQYKIGEVVAVAQSYQKILDTVFGEDQQWKYGYMRDVEESHEKMWEDIKGRTNKMFVKADIMPHKIRITDIKMERLQDISDIDCVKEGVRYFLEYGQERIASFYIDACVKDAFAYLIDKVSGKGTWERNPWVFAYSFKLAK